MIEIRDHQEVYNRVERPTIVYDTEIKIMIKIGELEAMEEYLEFSKQAYLNNGFQDAAKALALLELPPNQELVDNIFQRIDYLKTFLKTYDVC